MIAVLIPTYNRLELLKKCIASLKAQSVKSFKCIMITEPECIDTIEWSKTWRLDDRFEMIVNPERYGALMSCNKWSEANPGLDVIVGGDDLIFDPDCLKKASSWMNLAYPDRFGMIGIHQDTEDPSMPGAFSLIGRSIIDKFPKRWFFCPDYGRIYCDYELREFAKTHNVFAYNRMAVVKHTQLMDDTHEQNLDIDSYDRMIHEERAKKGYIWGKNFNLLNESLYEELVIG